jgi:hypothetical protein
MLICKGEKSYKCSKIKTFSVEEIQGIEFSILEPVSSTEIANIFEDDTFYFYDDVLKGRMIETNNKKMVGLSITYNADSTTKIIIKLTRKGVVDDES